MKGGELIKGEDKVKTDLSNLLYENDDKMDNDDWKVINILAYYFLSTKKQLRWMHLMNYFNRNTMSLLII